MTLCPLEQRRGASEVLEVIISLSDCQREKEEKATETGLQSVADSAVTGNHSKIAVDMPPMFLTSLV